MTKIKEDIIEIYVLKNAIDHEGKAAEGSVLGQLFQIGLKKEEIKDVMPIIKKLVSKINKLPREKQNEAFAELQRKENLEFIKKEERVGLPPLEGAEEGKVVMRFAPFPSGPIHIGNTRQVIINDEYVKKYKGKLWLVMDDTIGSEEKPIEPDAYKLIPASLKWLGVKHDKKIIYKSDRLKIYYKYAEELLEKGNLYVCSCSKEQVHDLREKGVECACRELKPKVQMERWKKMFKAKEGEYTVRLKTSMQDKNPAFRDRIMFRICEREHPKTKKKYRVWPLLEFSWAIDDHLLGMTHIIRGIDLMMESKVEEFIWDLYKWKKPIMLHTGFFKIEGVKISKSKGSKEVHSGTYTGWDDPRLWSLQSLEQRGILPETIREFIISMGMTKSNSTVAVDVIYAMNKRHLEDKKRYFFVPNPEKIEINAPKLKAELPFHPSKDLGKRTYKTENGFFIPKEDADLLEEGRNYRLMHLFNFLVKHENGERKFNFVSQDNDKNLNVKFIQWLPVSLDNPKTKILMPEGETIQGLGEPELIKAKVGDIIQFERFGFCRIHKVDKKKFEVEAWFAHK